MLGRRVALELYDNITQLLWASMFAWICWRAKLPFGVWSFFVSPFAWQIVKIDS
jgi:hypothetical protein